MINARLKFKRKKERTMEPAEKGISILRSSPVLPFDFSSIKTNAIKALKEGGREGEGE